MIRPYVRRKNGLRSTPPHTIQALLFSIAWFLLSEGAFSQPVINAFAPEVGHIGATVVITGDDFSPNAADNIVYFGASRAQVLGATSTSLSVVVPSGATYEPITVTTNGLTAFSKKAFGVLFSSLGMFNSQTLSAVNRIPIGFAQTAAAIHDMNSDGKPDLLVQRTDANLAVFLNNSQIGSFSFAPPILIPLAADQGALKLVDLDGDGLLDLAFTRYKFRTVAVFKNLSAGSTLSFGPMIEYSTNEYPKNVSVADFDGDGKPDLAVASGGTRNVISVYRNTSSSGTLSFTTKQDFPTADDPNNLTVGDIDGDSKADIVVTCALPPYPYNGSIYSFSVLRNISSIGNILFDLNVNITTAPGPKLVNLEDLDGDNRLDFIIGHASGIVSTFRNLSGPGNIVVGPRVDISVGSDPQDIAVTDLDGDGKADLVASDLWDDIMTGIHTRIFVFKNMSSPGSVSMDRKVAYNMFNAAGDVVTGDLDLDAKPDILVTGFSLPELSIFRNRGGEAKVTPSGSNPVSGPVINGSSWDPVVQTYHGNPYVQRHYDIEPVNNPSTSTATVTLFFTQQDFDNYNASPGHGLDLPTSPNDDLGKSALRVYQYHGFSTTTLPGSYTGPGVEINPDDPKILWNASHLWWEVTFNVTGFSGFFLSSAGNSLLPLRLLSFSAKRKDDQALIKLITTSEVNVDHIKLERSFDGTSFSFVGVISGGTRSGNATTYDYVDNLTTEPYHYYRLKIVDKDGKFSYSHIVSLNGEVISGILSSYPNPAKAKTVISHPASPRQAVILLFDINGRMISKTAVANNSSSTAINFTNYPKGIYQLVWRDGTRSLTHRVVVE